MSAEALDDITLGTLSALESRLNRVEHLLCGQKAVTLGSDEEPASKRLEGIERRLNGLVSRVRVYGELLRIQKAFPSLFHTSNPSEPPVQLSLNELQSIVLAAASSFPATSSALSAINDTPIPDPAQSAALLQHIDRMRVVEAIQQSQAVEIAELRARSENLVRAWYQGALLSGSARLAAVEGRAQKVEAKVRRAERAKADESVL
ncbi:hypothetical protein HOO65_070537 [Ceratocystis lukuohia]|uniref:Nuclear distribution protein RO10 n=1 Tax=Ceratocystis lukuohia TaxID=2019550 RepID=A0ABR4MCS5_9PEZI